MNEAQNNSILLVKIILFIHFIALFLYCVPDGILNQKVQSIAQAYANPLFAGRWNLFAPEPPQQHKNLIYRWKTDSVYNDWHSLTHLVKKKHDAVRIGPSTKMYHVLQNASHGLWEFYYSKKSKRDSIDLKNMEYLIEQQIRNNSDEQATEIEMALVIEGVPDFSSTQMKTDTLFFDPFTGE